MIFIKTKNKTLFQNRKSAITTMYTIFFSNNSFLRLWQMTYPKTTTILSRRLRSCRVYTSQSCVTWLNYTFRDNDFSTSLWHFLLKRKQRQCEVSIYHKRNTRRTWMLHGIKITLVLPFSNRMNASRYQFEVLVFNF